MHEQSTPDISMNANELYREDIFTDNKVGTIRRMTPVKSTGEDDADRSVIYMGSTQMMTPAGPLPLNFEIDANSLDQAVNHFGEGANKALEETMTELQEMRRQQASQIVMPGQASGSQIQMP